MAVGEVRLHAHARILFGKLAQHFSDRIHGHRRRAHLHEPTRLRSSVEQLSPRVPDRLQGGRHLREKRFARLGQRDLPRRPLQQPEPERSLERREPPAHRRARKPEGRCRPPHARELRDRREHPHRLELWQRVPAPGQSPPILSIVHAQAKHVPPLRAREASRQAGGAAPRRLGKGGTLPPDLGLLRDRQGTGA